MRQLHALMHTLRASITGREEMEHTRTHVYMTHMHTSHMHTIHTNAYPHTPVLRGAHLSQLRLQRLHLVLLGTQLLPHRLHLRGKRRGPTCGGGRQAREEVCAHAAVLV